MLQHQSFDTIACTDQWLALARALGFFQCDRGNLLKRTLQDGLSPRAKFIGRAGWSRSNAENGGILSSMRSAMLNLGSEATCREVREQIRNMPEFGGLSSRKSPNPGGTHKGGSNILVWEQTVGGNMPKLFDPVLDDAGVQLKRGGVKVWKQRD